MYSFYHKIEIFGSIIIFGASDIGRLIEAEIKEYCRETGKTLYFADNSYKKWNDRILCPSDAASRFPNALWIIASDIHNSSMLENLHNLNIKDDNIVRNPPTDIILQKQSEKKLKRLSPQGVLSKIEVDIAYHCNLNCSGCSVFSPLIKDSFFADFDIFDRDLERVSYLLHGILRELHIMGGEPLLNSQIECFIESVRKHFPNTVIIVVSNGLLLPKMSENFWNTCRKNDISINITRYPLSFAYDELPKLAESHGVKFEWFGIAVEKTTFNLAFDPLGKQSPYESFSNCSMANDCVRLNNGKLTTCSPIHNIDFFNKAFGTNMKPCPDDYIDIYNVKSGREIMDFLCKPIPFCRYCNVNRRTYGNPWCITKRVIDEWVITE
jgi:hypothetical protein